MNFSIIIPCWNQAEFLTDAIESALEQNSEVIVIDDGSPDATSEIAKKFPIKLIRQVNKGLASARNTGIMNASGDYILPLDADDILLPNCVKRMKEVIEATNADIVAPSLKLFGVSNNEVILADPIDLTLQKTGNHLPYFCGIRKSLLLESGGYSPRMTWGYEDYHLWFDLLNRGAKVAIIKEVLALYRTKTGSMLQTAQQHHDELMAQIQKDFKDIFV